jgi:uncharacterized protein (TIGR02996 family)
MYFRKGNRFTELQREGNHTVETTGVVDKPKTAKAIRKKYRTGKEAQSWLESRGSDLFYRGWMKTGKPGVEIDPVERARLLADVIAAPDEDGPRQVMADWLMERGDPQGELIMVQLALANPATDAKERERLEERESNIIQSYAVTWLAPLREVGVSTGDFRRGFVETINVDAESFIANAPKILARSPVRKVRVFSWKEKHKARIRKLAGRAAIEWVSPTNP